MLWFDSKFTTIVGRIDSKRQNKLIYADTIYKYSMECWKFCLIDKENYLFFLLTFALLSPGIGTSVFIKLWPEVAPHVIMTS